MTTEDEMVGWHHQFNGHEFEQALRDGEGEEKREEGDRGDQEKKRGNQWG